MNKVRSERLEKSVNAENLGKQINYRVLESETKGNNSKCNGEINDP